ncbi:MAG: fimbrillin family protein, partial [Alistipes sp.]
MKTLKRFMMLVAVAATALTTSCAKDAAEAPETAERMVTMTINASDKIVDMNSDTRTYIENGIIKWSATGEGLAVVETNVTATAHANTSKYTLGSDGKASFEVSFLPLIGATELHYSAVYPTDAFVSNNTAIDAIKVNLPQVQHPTATSYDPQADLLIAKRVTRVSQPSLTEPLNFAFGRVISFGHMSVKNLTLTAGELIKSVTVTVPDKVITGRGKVNLATGQALPDQWGYGNNNKPSATPTKYAFDNVTMEYTTPFAAAAFEAWFTCAPFELSATESFTVTVMTNKKIYTKTVTPAKVFAFTMGNSTSFGLNMNGIAGVDRVPDVTTGAASNVEATTSTVSGSYIDNDCIIAEAGFLYGTSETLEGLKASGATAVCATTTSPLTANLTGLTAGTKYSYCAYVKVNTTATYGPLLSFTTQSNTIQPGTILWSEDWTGGAASTVPSAYNFSGTTVFGGASVVYSEVGAGTKLYTEFLAGGTAPELLVKSKGSWTITGIPVVGVKSVKLIYNANNTNLASVTYQTTGATPTKFTVTASGKTYTSDPVAIDATATTMTI